MADPLPRALSMQRSFSDLADSIFAAPKVPKFPAVDRTNLEAADKELKLTDQEKFLYNMHLTNLASGGVPNNGGTSTLYQAVVEGPDGRFYNVPSVWFGKILSDEDAIAKEVARIGWDKFPAYASPEEADKRYEAMHQYIERDRSPLE